jgi:hypothetical protein
MSSFLPKPGPVSHRIRVFNIEFDAGHGSRSWTYFDTKMDEDSWKNIQDCHAELSRFRAGYECLHNSNYIHSSGRWITRLVDR